MPIFEGDTITYHCPTGNFLDTDNDLTSITVACGEDGKMQWPDPKPNCIDFLPCPDEPITPDASLNMILSPDYDPAHEYVTDETVKYIIWFFSRTFT